LTSDAPNGPQHVECGKNRHDDVRNVVLSQERIAAPASDPVTRSDRPYENSDQHEDQ
jgi:hypothetical protein